MGGTVSVMLFRHVRVGSTPTPSTETMNKKTLFPILSVALFLVFSGATLKLAYADFEISDGSVKVLYHLNNTLHDEVGVAGDLNANGSTNYQTAPPGLVKGVTTNNPDYFSSNNTINFTGATTAALGLWYRQAASGSTAVAVGNAGVSPLFQLAGGVPRCDFEGTDVSAPGNYDDGSWHFVVCRLLNGFETIYVDGIAQSVHSEGSAISGGAQTLFVGHYTGGTAVLNGAVSEAFVTTGTDLTTSTITSLYAAGSGVHICIVPGCGSGTPQADLEISMHSPADNTTLPDFTDWVLNATSSNGTTPYVIQVSYAFGGANTSSLVAVSQDTSGLFIQGNTPPTPHIPKAAPLKAGWYEVTPLMLEFGTGNIVAEGSSTFFKIDNASTPPSADTSSGPFYPNNLGGLLPPQYATSTTFCEHPSGISDIGGGISYAGCTLWNYIYPTMKTGLTVAIQQAESSTYAALQNTFPFSLPIQIYDLIRNDASSTLASTTPAMVTYVFPSYLPFPTSSRTIVLVSASTTRFDNGTPGGAEAENLWMKFQFYLATLLLAFIIWRQVRNHE